MNVIKKMLFLFFSIFCIFCNTDKALAASCTTNIKQVTYCDEDTGKNVSKFEDPSLTTIKQNKCSNFSKKINEYCWTYCREEATVNLPSTINPMAVDRYQPILGGNHFQWEKTSIITKRECRIEIDYEKWYQDYMELDMEKAEVTMKALQEWHQLNSDKACGEKGYFGKHSGSCACGAPTDIDYGKYMTKYRPKECDRKGVKCTAHRVKGDIDKDENKTETECRANPGSCYIATCPAGYALEESQLSPDGTGSVKCVYWDVKADNRGTWRAYRQIQIDGSTVVGVKIKDYCSTDGLQYWDDEQIDKYWNDTYKKLVNNINKKVTALRQCNNSANVSLKSTPKVTVTYTDPMRKYTSAQGRKIELKGTLESSVPSDEGTQKAPSIGPKIQKTVCNLPVDPTNPPASFFKPGKSPCRVTFTNEYGDLLNSVVQKSVTNTYSYTMPNNIYRYILKETGESVDSNSSKVTGEIRDNYRYIDIGYPNYPVHYTTPTGEYPIYLTYTNLGTNGYFTNKLPNKTGRYDCTYKVINRIKTCPEGECPDPDPGGGGGQTNPPGGGKDNPLGINVVYRPISLVNPFPGKSGKGRKSGQNWSDDDINKYIKNNRGSDRNQVYNETPLYSFTLDAPAIKQIKQYNKGKISLDGYTVNQNDGYADFNLTCSNKKNGKQCKSKFLKNITQLGVKVNTNKCLNSTDFYGCAEKPNQDNVYCSLNKENNNKYECINCGLPQNSGSSFCKAMDKKRKGDK